MLNLLLLATVLYLLYKYKGKQKLWSLLPVAVYFLCNILMIVVLALLGSNGILTPEQVKDKELLMVGDAVCVVIGVIAGVRVYAELTTRQNKQDEVQDKVQDKAQD